MMQWLSNAMPHLTVAPILLPMLTAAILVAVREKYRKTRSFINILSCLCNVLIACGLIYWVKEFDSTKAFAIYLPANWDIPFGITLLADRLSALMLLVTSLIGLGVSLYSVSRWNHAGVHFQTLFQVQLMGINGAFLTADLFNLFVFFEILLAASYGLVLHGSGPKRVRAGLHYIAINLVASFFFLIGVALIYNATGSLSFAEIARHLRVGDYSGHEALFTSFGILAVAFLAKTAMWPLNFWLVPAYSAASAPTGAIFAVLTKVGVYILLRLTSLFFSDTSTPAEQWFGSLWLTYGGMCTVAFGTLGILCTLRPSRLAGYATLISSGTLIIAISFGQISLTSAALYYLPASTLAIAAFFLISELIERTYTSDEIEQRTEENEEDRMVFHEPGQTWQGKISVNLDERQEEIIGRVIPAAMAFLGVTFALSVLLISGLPPFSSFVAKFGILSALINPYGLASSNIAAVDYTRWIAVILIIVSGLFSLVSFTRAGIRYFWSPLNQPTPKLRVIECIPVVILLCACVLLTLRAEISMRYTRATSAALYAPEHYINAIFSQQPLQTPTNRERLSATQHDPESTSSALTAPQTTPSTAPSLTQ